MITIILLIFYYLSSELKMLRWIYTNIARTYVRSKIKVRENTLDYYIAKLKHLDKILTIFVSILCFTLLILGIFLLIAGILADKNGGTKLFIGLGFMLYALLAPFSLVVELFIIKYPLLILKQWQKTNKGLSDEFLLDNKIDFDQVHNFEQIQLFQKSYRFVHPRRIVFITTPNIASRMNNSPKWIRIFRSSFKVPRKPLIMWNKNYFKYLLMMQIYHESTVNKQPLNINMFINEYRLISGK
ncbi:hypothetical protein H9M94_00845 [Mycoplasma sp. Pen4]|uniref:hypothetical protein n=1 Tax=Mycoplasma sp. Pen4 TaxID=640330 RepID=UPI001654A2FA|nr:hypothetical protein [Mycoplasma sp. Pen4]QNM93809.1 hypothetical protein H9M94_00845 [Mycoplasma sp. Pen4]